MIKFKFKESNELLSSHTGTALTGLLLQMTMLKERLSGIELYAGSTPEIPHGDVVAAMIGLLTIGQSNYDDIEQFREDPFFAKSLGLSRIPASPTMRQRFDEAGTQFNLILKEESVKLLERMAKLTQVFVGKRSFVPLDLDVTPMDNSRTKKEGVSYTYKGFDGFAPMMAYLGKEGHLINLELREGKQHSQCGTPGFLKETLSFAKTVTSNDLLVRMDSGNDAVENVKILYQAGVSFIIKRNLRRESKDQWLEIAMKHGTEIQLGSNRTRWIGKIERSVDGVKEPVSIVFDVVRKTCEESGQLHATPDIEIETYWAHIETSPEETEQSITAKAIVATTTAGENLKFAKRVIDSYHAHGESEQFHSEYKTEMGLERLPSGKFDTNALILHLGMIAFNIFRICGQKGLEVQERLKQEDTPIQTHRRTGVLRRRIRSVLLDIMRIAAHITTSSGYFWISFGRCSAWADVFKLLYQDFSSPPLPAE